MKHRQHPTQPLKHMTVLINGSYYQLHDHNKEHPQTSSYCVCCIQYIKHQMREPQFQKVLIP